MDTLNKWLRMPPGAMTPSVSCILHFRANAEDLLMGQLDVTSLANRSTRAASIILARLRPDPLAIQHELFDSPPID
tara:strand:- start:2401 stop:2628 length:228 start_codon:yes stop_codon:yes gene_type:complete